VTDLIAGRIAWRISPNNPANPRTRNRAEAVRRCVVTRIRFDGLIEVATSVQSGERRIVLEPTEVFADQEAAKAEAQRRHVATQEPKG
jgi:antibiotic biosynthesis monooxygenase (ABM) superfamily enzyme